MSERTELGKIEEIRVGFVEDNDVEFGAHFTFSGPGFGVQKSIGFPCIPPNSRTSWTEKEQKIRLGEVCLELVKLMKDAGVRNIMSLRNVPVALVIENNTLKSWRILTEVL